MDGCAFVAVIEALASKRRVEKKREGISLVVSALLKADDLDYEIGDELCELQRSAQPVICRLICEEEEDPLDVPGLVERQSTVRRVDGEDTEPHLVTTVRLVTDALGSHAFGVLRRFQGHNVLKVELFRQQPNLPGTA